jgi:hypothetical protein
VPQGAAPYRKASDSDPVLAPIRLSIGGRRLAAALEAVARQDAIGLPLLGPAAHRRLLVAVRALSYGPCKPGVGEGQRRVRQRFSLCMDIPESHAVRALAAALNAAFAGARNHLPVALAEAVPCFNDLIVQRYDPGALGITPHRDHVRYTGVVAIVVLSGRARFCVCRDRSGRGAREIACPPGGMILMRAPGALSDRRPDRPFHFVADIEARRYTVGIRHDSRDPAPVGRC